ncbi:hypothetical protein J3F82_003508 [Coemansia sp. RSA 637]|nr:hypothetical protein J3F82_003508 [Coemansia sp. RSA 637]
MSTKRGFVETDTCPSDCTPYTTYQEAHNALQALKHTSHAGILEHAERALLTVSAQHLPSAIRQIGVRLATIACAHPEPNSASIAASLVRALKDADPSIRCEIYASLITLHEIKSQFHTFLSPEVTNALGQCVRTDVNHSQHHLRSAAVACLQIVGGNNGVRRFTDDAHPKVRQTALSVIQRQQMVGKELGAEMYGECVAATLDDAEQVRMIAVSLVWAIGSQYAKHVSLHNLRLLDDAFIKVCDMVNDSSMLVRQRACLILGRFRRVSPQYLEQTFSKQVMSNLRSVPRSLGYGRNRGLHSSKFHQRETVDELRLLDSGAAGAFVHGLEDEYQEVRDAAIESILELSSESPVFASRAVDFLVDMFNDSSDRVRVRAIRALTVMGTRSVIYLTDEQLSIAVSAIKDSSQSVRLRIYEFLSVSVVSSNGLQQLMHAIQDNLEAYSSDLLPVYRALKLLGANHSNIITPQLTCTLLNISQHYLSREARIDDVVYAGNVILVINTKRATRHAVASVLPDYVFGHLPYLCDKYPGCLPNNLAEYVPAHLPYVRQMLVRPTPDTLVTQMTRDDDEQQTSALFTRMQRVLNKACEEPASGQIADDLVLAARTFLHTATAECRQKVVARYAELVSIGVKIKVMVESHDTMQVGELFALTARLMHGSYEIEARTQGLDPLARTSLVYLRVLAHTAWLFAHSLSEHDPRVSAKMREELQLRTTSVAQALSSDKFTAAKELLSALSNDQTPEILQHFVREFRALEFVPKSQCQYARAEIQLGSRRPLEFDHRFPLRVPINARLFWTSRNIVANVTLPTQTTRVWRVPPNFIKPCGLMQSSLVWDVEVELPLGSGEVAAVKVAVGMECASDVPWSDAFVVRAASVPVLYDITDYYKKHESHVVVEISSLQTLSVNPIEIRPQPSAHTRI